MRHQGGSIHCWLDILLGKNKHGGKPEGGVAGAQPLHKGGPKARPPKCEERKKRSEERETDSPSGQARLVVRGAERAWRRPSRE